MKAVVFFAIALAATAGCAGPEEPLPEHRAAFDRFVGSSDGVALAALRDTFPAHYEALSKQSALIMESEGEAAGLAFADRQVQEIAAERLVDAAAAPDAVLKALAETHAQLHRTVAAEGDENCAAFSAGRIDSATMSESVKGAIRASTAATLQAAVAGVKTPTVRERKFVKADMDALYRKMHTLGIPQSNIDNIRSLEQKSIAVQCQVNTGLYVAAAALPADQAARITAGFLLAR
jgi:hypothetical protein